MPSIFEKIDKIRPLYDAVYKFVLFICKLLLVVDIAITSMSVAGRYISFIPDPAWSEEVVLSCMAYMPKNLVKFLDILADVAVLVLAVIMLTVGWTYASGIGSKGTYVSMPGVSRFWMYLPVPLAGVAMIIFEIEALYNHIRSFYVKEEK